MSEISSCCEGVVGKARPSDPDPWLMEAKGRDHRVLYQVWTDREVVGESRLSIDPMQGPCGKERVDPCGQMSGPQRSLPR